LMKYVEQTSNYGKFRSTLGESLKIAKELYALISKYNEKAYSICFSKLLSNLNLIAKNLDERDERMPILNAIESFIKEDLNFRQDPSNSKELVNTLTEIISQLGNLTENHFISTIQEAERPFKKFSEPLEAILDNLDEKSKEEQFEEIIQIWNSIESLVTLRLTVNFIYRKALNNPDKIDLFAELFNKLHTSNKNFKRGNKIIGTKVLFMDTCQEKYQEETNEFNFEEKIVNIKYFSYFYVYDIVNDKILGMIINELITGQNLSDETNYKARLASIVLRLVFEKKNDFAKSLLAYLSPLEECCKRLKDENLIKEVQELKKLSQK